MASCSVVIQPAAEAEFRAVPFPFRRQLNQKIYALKEKPRPAEAQLIDGELHLLRVSGWGLLYEVDDEEMQLVILAVVPPP